MRLSFLLTLFATSLAAESVTGIWIGQMVTRPGSDPVDVSIKLAEKDGRIEGKVYGDYVSTPISEGKIENGELVFYVVAPEQAGNEINRARIKFSGRFEGSRLELTRQRESSMVASNGGSAPQRANQPVRLSLRRLL